MRVPHRIVPSMNSYLVGRRRRGERRGWSDEIAFESPRCDPFQSPDSVHRGGRVRGIGDDENRGTLAANELAAKVGWYLNSELDGSRQDQVVEFAFTRHPLANVEIAGRPHRGEERPCEDAFVLRQHGCSKFLRIGVDRIPEKKELDQGDENHRNQRHPITSQLDEFLDKDRHKAPPCRHRSLRGSRICQHRGHLKLSRPRSIRSMKTSSSVGWSRRQL